MLRGQRTIFVLIAAIVGAAIFLFFKSKWTQDNKFSYTDYKTSSAIAETRVPASETGAHVTAAVPVIRVVGEGRESLRIAVAQNLEAELQRKEDFLSKYRVGQRDAMPGAATYEMLKLKAIPRGQYDPRLGERITEKLGFVIYAAPSTKPFELAVDGSLPVVAQKSNGMLGIVTGTIVVTLKQSSMAQGLAQSYDLTLKYLDKDMRLAYFSAPDKTALDQVVVALQKDSAVEHVNLEIVQSKKRM